MTRAAARENIRQYYWGGPYLLDTYTGAAFAYSFRRLRKTYYGPVVRIRESGGDTEKDFGTTYQGNFDTAGVASFLGANTGYITKWYDQSGNGLDITQTTTTSQPTYLASGISSLPSVSFTGTAVVLETSAIDLTTYISTQGTVLACMLQAGSTAQHTLFAWQPTSAANRFVCHPTYDNVIYFDFGNDSTGRLSVAQPTGWDDTKHILELYRDSSDLQGIVVDGSSLATNTLTQDVATGSAALFVGALSSSVIPFVGYLSELVAWGTDLGATNRAAARNAINSYYSVF